MSLALRSILLFIILNIFFSCGKKHYDDEDRLYIQAMNNLDKRNYRVANSQFKKLVQKYPNNREYKQYYADTFLGLGALSFSLF